MTALADQRAQEGALQAELDRLYREAALKDERCEIERAPQRVERTRPDELAKAPDRDAAKPDKSLVIPPRVDAKAPCEFLKGCWIAGEKLIASSDPQGKYPYNYRLCFNEQCVGESRRTFEGGAVCQGPIQVQRGDRKLTFRLSEASCPRGPLGSNFSPSVVTCEQASSQTEASCVSRAEGLPDVSIALRRE